MYVSDTGCVHSVQAVSDFTKNEQAKKEGRKFLRSCNFMGIWSRLSASICTSRASNTWKAYRPWVEGWQSWVARKGFKVITPIVVATFLTRVKSHKSVAQAAAALKLFFSLHNICPNPANSVVVALVTANARRSGLPAKRKSAFSKSQVQKLLTYLQTNPSLPNLRLASMISLCFMGCLRINECVGLNLCDVIESKDCIELRIRGAKTDRDRNGQHTLITKTGGSFCVARVLHSYLSAAQLTIGHTGPVFRIVRHVSKRMTGHAHKASRLTYTIARDALKDALEASNIKGNYSWHSFRAGAASEALRLGAAVDLVRTHGRWASWEGMAPYVERTVQQKSLVSRYLGL